MKKRIVGIDFACCVDVLHTRAPSFRYTADEVRRLIGRCADAGATGVLWRTASTGQVSYQSAVRTPLEKQPWPGLLAEYDPPRVAIDAAHQHGLDIYLYTTLFDEAYPDMPSAFGREHPEYCWRHRHFEHRNPGLLSLGYPEVRAYKLDEVRELIAYGATGVYLDCARSHAGIWPLMCLPFGYDVYANYGFNDHECAEYERITGRSPRLSNLGKVELEQIDWNLWQRVRGSFLTKFIREASSAIREAHQQVGVGFYTDAACYLSPAGERGRQILGKLHIDFDTWIDDGLIDWIHLIAEHRRFGWPDWERHSAAQFAAAQAKGIDVYLWAAAEQGIDELPDPPAPLPIRLSDQPDLLMRTVADNIARSLRTTANGVVAYEAAWQEEARLVSGHDYWNCLREGFTHD